MKIRVLEILATLKRAGAEHVATALACRLDRDRFETAVVSLFDAFPGGLEPVLAEHGVPVWHLGKRRGLDLRIYPRLARIFAEFAPQVIHTHSYVMRYALPAAMGKRAAIVHTVHNMAGSEVEWLGRMIHRVGFRWGVVPVAVADEVARSVRAVYGIEPAATIPNGIDTGRFHRPGARGPWRQANGFAEEDVLVVSVARLDPQKEPVRLIEAFAAFATGDAHGRLLMAGDGALRDEARSRAEALGIAGRVHFLGVRSDVADLLAAADVFALASSWEGHPISVMEAMAAGLPVVATAVGGVPELVDDGVTGLLVPAGDSRALAAALASLVTDAGRRREFGRAARERAGELQPGRDGGLLCCALRTARRRTTMTARVVLLTTNLARGGAEMQVAQLAAGLARRGWEVAVVSMLPVTAFERELADAGVAVHSLEMSPGRPDLPALVRLGRLLEQLRPQVLHGHMFHANMLARVIRFLCPVPVVISTAHTLIESGRHSGDPRGRERIYRSTARLADATVCVCDAIAARYAERKIVPRARLRTIPNGVDTNRFRPDEATRQRMRGELGLGSGFVWLAVGRLMWKKDYETMLAAFARQGLGTLLIAGEGPQEAELRELAGRTGADVRFLGLREDIPALMSAADGFVLSSVVEGLPMVLLEAISSGLPSVATNVGGTGEAVVSGETGYLVPPGDGDALATAMGRLMNLAPEERAAMGAAAQRYAVDRFDQEVVTGRWESLYHDLLAAKVPAWARQ